MKNRKFVVGFLALALMILSACTGDGSAKTASESAGQPNTNAQENGNYGNPSDTSGGNSVSPGPGTNSTPQDAGSNARDAGTSSAVSSTTEPPASEVRGGVVDGGSSSTQHQGNTNEGTPSRGTSAETAVAYFESTKFGFRIPLIDGITVIETPIPDQPGEFTNKEETIGAFQVKDSAGSPEFLITIEQFKEGLKPDGTPVVVPSEGGLSEEFTIMTGGYKGYWYTSNAEGMRNDAHITVFRQDRIFYLRKIGERNSVVQALVDFDRNFEITR